MRRPTVALMALRRWQRRGAGVVEHPPGSSPKGLGSLHRGEPGIAVHIGERPSRAPRRNGPCLGVEASNEAQRTATLVWRACGSRPA